MNPDYYQNPPKTEKEPEKEYLGLTANEWLVVGRSASTAAIAAYTTAKALKKAKH